MLRSLVGSEMCIRDSICSCSTPSFSGPSFSSPANSAIPFRQHASYAQRAIKEMSFHATGLAGYSDSSSSSVAHFITKLKLFAIKCSKTTKIYSFWLAQFLRNGGPNILRQFTQFISAIYAQPFGRVWLSSVRLSPSAKPGNGVECRIYGRWVKTPVLFSGVCKPNFMKFWDSV